MKTIAFAIALFAVSVSAHASGACAFGDATFANGCESASADARSNMALQASKARAARVASNSCAFGDGSFENGCSGGKELMAAAAAEAVNAKRRSDHIRWGWIDGDV